MGEGKGVLDLHLPFFTLSRPVILPVLLLPETNEIKLVL